MSKPPVVFLMGPTGAGKTAVALALGQRLPIDVISVDAAQIYRGLDVGTAKPSLAERRAVPHALVDIRDVAETYSAAVFCADASRLITASFRRGRVPVLVGGSSFYFRALERGLPELPTANPELRAQLAAEWAERGLAALYAELARCDPLRAQAIAPTDPQRILRALEIVRMAGSVPVLGSAVPAMGEVAILKFAVMTDERRTLHGRIAVRFRRMLARGIIEEAMWLHGQDLPPIAPALRLVGYRQLGEYLRGKIQYNELVEQETAATRQLAKRQLTWLRADPGVRWLDGGSLTADHCAARIREVIERRLDYPSVGK